MSCHEVSVIQNNQMKFCLEMGYWIVYDAFYCVCVCVCVEVIGEF